MKLLLPRDQNKVTQGSVANVLFKGAHVSMVISRVYENRITYEEDGTVKIIVWFSEQYPIEVSVL
jgi:hypothetical protein